MTTAEIIKGLKAVRTIHNGNYAPCIDGAIKELEALDKIRTEVESINLNEVAAKYEDRFYGFQQETLAILDKYKAETEADNGNNNH